MTDSATTDTAMTDTAMTDTAMTVTATTDTAARNGSRRLAPIALLAIMAGAAAGLSLAPLAHARDASEPAPDLLWQMAMLASASQANADALAMQADAEDDAAAPAAPVAKAIDAMGRRIMSSEPTVLAFKNVTVEQVVPFIMEITGKVVMVQPDVLNRRITLLNDQPIAPARALDLVFLALQQTGVGVVEQDDLITLRVLEEIDRQDVPVIGPEQSLLSRTDRGSIVEKVFALRYASAANIYEQIKDTLPLFAKRSFDPESNQLVVMGNIGLLQRIERLVSALDQPASALLVTESFRLRYGDAEQIAQNIRDLYGANAGSAGRQGGNNVTNPFQGMFGSGGQNNRQNQQNQQGGRSNTAGQQRRGDTEVQTSSNLRAIANVQQNSVTVLAERAVLEEVRRQINENWDRPLQNEAVVPKVYELKNSDPIKVRDLLTTLFGNPGQSRAQGQSASTESTANRLFGQFSFEAIPEAGRVVVVSRSPENLKAIDQIIAEVDQPLSAGLPQIVELKHAQAEELAEQLNAILSREGTLAQITRSESGLSTSATSTSPFATNQQTNTGTTNQNTNQQNQQGTTGNVITLWWQRSQPPTNAAGSSNLVGKIRIVPVWRQNSLMILSPPEYRSSLVEVIKQLDQAGRQVLLSAVIAEINIEDATAVGLRWSNSAINPTRQDNAISVGPSTAGTTAGGTITGQKNDLLPGLFDTSVLNLGVNINAMLQLLAQKTGVNILSEPRIFTSDNQEAEFFSGQDIPFITQSQTNTNGNLVQSFDYRAVGIALRVRPRITMNRDVDLRINLELSSIQPNSTLFGGFIVDRRETTTHLIVQDGQTVVVSGILRTEDSDINRKVPLLGDLPLLGPLFQSVERTKRKTELVAFITPFVVGTSEDNDRINKRDREHLDQVREKLRPTEELGYGKDGSPKSGKAPEAAKVLSPSDSVTPAANSAPILPAAPDSGQRFGPDGTRRP